MLHQIHPVSVAYDGHSDVLTQFLALWYSTPSSQETTSKPCDLLYLRSTYLPILRLFAKVQTFDAYNAAVERIAEDATLAKTKNLTALRQSVGEEVTRDVPVYMRNDGVLVCHGLRRPWPDKKKQKRANLNHRNDHHEGRSSNFILRTSRRNEAQISGCLRSNRCKAQT